MNEQPDLKPATSREVNLRAEQGTERAVALSQLAGVRFPLVISTIVGLSLPWKSFETSRTSDQWVSGWSLLSLDGTTGRLMCAALLAAVVAFGCVTATLYVRRHLYGQLAAGALLAQSVLLGAAAASGNEVADSMYGVAVAVVLALAGAFTVIAAASAVDQP